MSNSDINAFNSMSDEDWIFNFSRQTIYIMAKSFNCAVQVIRDKYVEIMAGGRS